MLGKLARNTTDFVLRPAALSTRMLLGGLWKDALLRGDYRASLKRWGLALGSPIPQVGLESVVNAEDRPVLVAPTRRDGNLSLDAQYCLASLVVHLRPRRIFEIGTFNGNTTMQMAANSVDDCRIFTLDLPGGAPSPTRYAIEREDEKYVGSDGVVFAGTRFERKIERLFGDSARFDFAPFQGGIDLVFVDGAHSYEYVKSDTEQALRMLSDGGAIVWDDYDPCWPEVVRYLNELSRTKRLVWIRGTGLCLYRSAPRDS